MHRAWFAFLLLVLIEPVQLFAQAKLRILTTVLPAYCFTHAIAGNSAQVENLLSSSVEPHDYQLSPVDLRRLQSADLVVANGLGFEPWLEKALPTPNQKRKLALLSDGFGPDVLIVGGDGEINPHTWLDPFLAMRSVTNILKTLQGLDPRHGDSYSRNAAVFLQRLRDIDRKMGASLQPVTQRAFITYHDAFPYFAKHFHLNLAGVVERIPEVPPSARELVQLFQIIRRDHVHAIFTELIDPPRLARQIAKDASLTLAALDTIETGPADPSFYEKTMLQNAAMLARTLSP
jgi:zinc transport system substrate-binding protein